MTMLHTITFVALTLAIIGLWVRPSAWMAAFAVSIVLGYVSHILYGLAVVWFAMTAAACWFYAHSQATAVRVVAAIAIVVMSLALGLHVLPGFQNPQVARDVVLSDGAVPYNMYLNFDKTVLGLLFIGLAYTGLIRSPRELIDALETAGPLIVANIALVTIVSLSLGYLHFDPHTTSLFWVWCFGNLFLTCLSEEAFFRAFIQRGIANTLRTKRYGATVALISGSVLFGLAHIAGGWTYVALATIAGLGYGYIFQRTKRIEMSILAHFAMNATHFLLFTYPRLA
jgi:uncharacterized protein